MASHPEPLMSCYVPDATLLETLEPKLEAVG